MRIRSTRGRITALAAVASLTLVAAACGSDDDDVGAATDAPAAATEAPAADRRHGFDDRPR